MDELLCDILECIADQIQLLVDDVDVHVALDAQIANLVQISAGAVIFI